MRNEKVSRKCRSRLHLGLQDIFKMWLSVFPFFLPFLGCLLRRCVLSGDMMAANNARSIASPLSNPCGERAFLYQSFSQQNSLALRSRTWFIGYPELITVAKVI